jgi:hypothetical protein
MLTFCFGLTAESQLAFLPGGGFLFNGLAGWTVGLTAGIALAGSGAVWVFDEAGATGFLLGGLGSAAGFWYLANRYRKFATLQKDALTYLVYRWTLIRMGMYGLVLIAAYWVDREGQHGLIGAAAGLLLARVVMLGVALALRGRAVEG